jgi:hypothetical protein
MGTGTVGADPITIASGSLTVPGLAPSIGNSITYGGLGLTDRIALGSNFTTGILYYSFAFKITDLGGLNTSGGFMAGFNSATGSSTTQPTIVGTRLITKVNGLGFQVGLDKSSGTAGNFVFATPVFNLGDTVFVVGSYTFNSGSTTDDEARLWVNPDMSTFGLATPPPETLFSLTTNDLTQIASFLFRQGSSTAVPGAVIADELRVDTTWAGVTVPESSGILCLALAGGGLIARRRRLRS